jgi:hypothetical protein
LDEWSARRKASTYTGEHKQKDEDKHPCLIGDPLYERSRPAPQTAWPLDRQFKISRDQYIMRYWAHFTKCLNVSVQNPNTHFHLVTSLECVKRNLHSHPATPYLPISGSSRSTLIQIFLVYMLFAPSSST